MSSSTVNKADDKGVWTIYIHPWFEHVYQRQTQRPNGAIWRIIIYLKTLVTSFEAVPPGNPLLDASISEMSLIQDEL